MHGCTSQILNRSILCPWFILLIASHANAQAPQFQSITGASTLPVVRWSSVTGANGYAFQVAIDAQFSSIILDDSTGADTVRVIGPLPPDTGYYCRVAGLLQDGPTGWSEALRFYAETTRSVFTMPLSSGWNLISLPFSVSDSTRNFLFPGSCTAPSAFCYYGTYDCCAGYRPLHSYGFWTRSAEPKILGVTGIPLIADTQSLSAGWNLVGSLISPLPAASAYTNPSGVIPGSFFGYTSFSYAVTDSLRPFKGYWVRASGSGEIILPQPRPIPSGIIAYVHWQKEPVPGIKILLVGTGDTLTTDSTGMATFTVPAGKYTVRAFDINRGGPALISVDFDVAVRPGETTTVDIVDCLPCD